MLGRPRQTGTGSDIVVTPSDVRAIQLAKAALYAGAKLLMAARRLSTGWTGSCWLAPLAGTSSPFHAMVLGLIPDCELERVTAVGNAAGDGARIALLNAASGARPRRLAHWVKHVQTAVAPGFQDEFVAALALPHGWTPSRTWPAGCRARVPA